MKKNCFLIPLFLLFFTGCGVPVGITPTLYNVVLEEGAGYTAEDYVCRVTQDGTAEFSLCALDGYDIVGTNRTDCTLERNETGFALRIEHVRYSQRIRVIVRPSDTVFTYDPNGGVPEERVSVPVTPSHLRLNTAGLELFNREGYTLIGWNTRPDGSGTAVGLGSRISPQSGLVLYAQWRKWNEPAEFQWTETASGVTITDWSGNSETLVIPAVLDGLPVTVIGQDAFAGAESATVILPPTLKKITDGAFTGAAVETLYLYDNLQTFSDYAFPGCDKLTTLHINAAEPPCYSGTYYATFADKFDRLVSLADKPKLVLFSGSSTRFGYDSAALDEAFPEREVVNMGVFAYSNALPQLELIRHYMQEGDILLHSPELDAAQRQFCTSTNLDAPFFYMMEVNYDMINLLDLRNYTQIFTALHTFFVSREGLPARSYALSPTDFDEDGNPSGSPSYNEYGDYILYRPNSETEQPIYGLPVRYTPAAYPLDSYVSPLNDAYALFLDKGIRVYFTWSPRNRLALSDDSNPAALETYLWETLCVPVISRIAESLVSGTYLYGTDNHLSTEGVQIRTEQIIRDISRQMEADTYG